MTISSNVFYDRLGMHRNRREVILAAARKTLQLIPYRAHFHLHDVVTW